MDKQEVIRAYIAAGYVLIPTNGKIPVDKDWPNTPKGKYDETNLVGNYGVVLGPEDLLIDVDTRNFPEGDPVFDRFIKDLGINLLQTYVVGTGGGGYHLYFRKPANVSIVGSLKEYPGIEFKTVGRQVVGPGSIHPTTSRPYVVKRGRPEQMADAPEVLLKRIATTSKPKEANKIGTGGYIDDEPNQKRFADFLRSMAEISVEGQHGDDTAFKIACRGRDLGLSPEVVFSLLFKHWNPRCKPPWEADDLRAKVSHAWLYARNAVGSAHPAASFEKINGQPEGDAIDQAIGKSGWRLDNKKQPIKCFQNLLNYFSLSTVNLRGVFGFNEFTRRIEFLVKPPWQRVFRPNIPLQDSDLAQLRAHLARDHGYEAGIGDLVDAITAISQRYKFHPVREYLNGLKWDGVPRLDFWLSKYLGVMDEPYTRAVARKTLCAAVARVFEPGCKFDHVLVLEGPQGIGKSGVCRILGGEWFSDFRLSVDNKDTIQMMQGSWIVEMAELHSVRQTDTDALKAFLTRQVDKARFAYGRLAGEYPRQGIFIATYNPGPDGTYLKDDTGNRRWWPVRCFGTPPGNRTFDFEGLKVVKNQLFAEAVEQYKKGEKLTMDTIELQDAAIAAQAERHGEHPWAERIDGWVREQDKNVETRRDFYTGREIYLGAMQGLDSRFNRREQLDVGRAMRDLNWEPGSKRFGDKMSRGYWRPQTLRENPLDIFGDLV